MSFPVAERTLFLFIVYCRHCPGNDDYPNIPELAPKANIAIEMIMLSTSMMPIIIKYALEKFRLSLLASIAQTKRRMILTNGMANKMKVRNQPPIDI